MDFETAKKMIDEAGFTRYDNGEGEVDGSIDPVGGDVIEWGYVSWWPSESITLDGTYSLRQLEALVVWMRHFG